MHQIRQKLALHWNRKVVSRFVRDDRMQDRAVSVMMPLAPKDMDRAAVSIPMLRRNLMHPIAEFIVVSPPSAEIAALCEGLGVRHVDERPALTRLLGAEGLARSSGWIRQQMLKLAAPEVTGADTVLVMDSDTYPQHPTAFTEAGRTILYRGDRNMAPFQRFTEALIGPTPAAAISFVAHTMLFEAHHLGALRAEIERRHAASWVETILAHVARPVDEVGLLSEFDLYGHFLLRTAPDAVTTRYYANIKVPTPVFCGEQPLAPWQRRFRFLSNHQRGPAPA